LIVILVWLDFLQSKLDQYKAEQSQGKDLNADQLSAVSKYTEVTQQLDLARDLVKQFTEISTEVKRQIKREQRKENAERLVMTAEKIRQLLFFQSILSEVVSFIWMICVKFNCVSCSDLIRYFCFRIDRTISSSSKAHLS